MKFCASFDSPILAFGIFVALIQMSCASPSTPSTQSADPEPAEAVARSERHAFEFVGGHLTTVEVQINDTIEKRFILDTGIGVNLISKSLCDRVDCEISGEHTGERMSGQQITVPMSSVSSLALGSHRQVNVPVGVWDMEGLLPDTPEFADIAGFLSLNFFEDRPFTLDYEARSIVLETEDRLRERKEAGVTIPISVERDGPSLTIFTSLDVCGVAVESVVIDTGSGSLILDADFMTQLSVDPDSDAVVRKQGTDETGSTFERFFTKLDCPVQPTSAPAVQTENVDTMFQDIIYDGLIGQTYLRKFSSVTIDLRAEEIIIVP